MQQISVTINHASGLHARPAAQFVQTAKQYTSSIIVRNGAKQANAKSIVQVLTLGAKQGIAVTIEADGADEQQALDALKSLIDTNFGEAA